MQQAYSLTSKGTAAVGRHFKWANSHANGRDSQNRSGDYVSILAVEDTTVTISDYDEDVVFDGAINALNMDLGNGKGETVIELLAGETINVRASTFTAVNRDGLIGADILSTGDIVVNAGSNYLSWATKRDLGIDQLVPVGLVGKEYVVIAGGSASNERVTVTATADNTEIRVAGVLLATINEGEFYDVLGSNFSSDGNMFIETNMPTYIYHSLYGGTAPNTVGSNFIPPFSCFAPNKVDEISNAFRVGTRLYSNSAIIVTTLPGSTVTLNGTPISQTLANAVPGTSSHVTYKIPYSTAYPLRASPSTTSPYSGNTYEIESTSALAVGIFGGDTFAGFGGYFSGFGDTPVIITDADPVCDAGDLVVSEGPWNIFRWFKDGVEQTCITGNTFANAGPGEYTVEVGVTGSSCAVDSAPLTVYETPELNLDAPYPFCGTAAATQTFGDLDLGGASYDPEAIIYDAETGGNVVSNSTLVSSLVSPGTSKTFYADYPSLIDNPCTLDRYPFVVTVYDDDDPICYMPELESTKSFGTTVLADDGSFTVPVTITVENIGNVEVDNLQVIDDLASATNFGTAFDSITVAPTIVVTDDGNVTTAVVPTANASAFNGDAQPNILAGTDGVLGVDDILTITFTAKIDPNAEDAPTTLGNIAQSSGEDPSGTSAMDSSGAGAGENTGEATILTPPETNPELRSTKAFGIPVLASDGTFTVPVTIKVENTGNVDIDNLQITDNLAASTNLGTAFDSVIGTPSITVTDDGNVTTAVAPTANATAFNGNTQPNILSGTDGVLGLDDSVTVVFTIKVNPNAVGAPTTLKNTAQSSGKDPSGSATTDSSGGAAGEDTGSPTVLTAPTTNPELTSVKTFGTPVLASDGTFTVPVTIEVDNTGDVDVSNLQITDDLADGNNFGDAFQSVTIAPSISVADIGPATSAAAVAPSANGTPFNGGSQPNILLGTDGVLGVGDSVTVVFTIKVDPNVATAPTMLKNTAQTSATDPSGMATTDSSGGAGGENTGTPTPLTAPETEAQLTSTKIFGTPVLAADGTFTVLVTIELDNTGNVDVTNLQITDDLADASNLGSAFQSITVAPSITTADIGPADAATATTPSANAGFDGDGQPNILSGTDGVLGVGDSVTVVYTIKVDPNAAGAPTDLKNTAKVSATDPSGKTVTDSSGGAGGENTGVPVSLTPLTTHPQLTTSKNFGATSDIAPDGTFTVPVTIKVVNTGDVNVENLQISDNLADGFNLGTTFDSITVAPAISVADDGPATAATVVIPSANAMAFDGDSQPDILSGIDGVLGVGDSVTVVFTIKVNPNAAGAPADLLNTAQANATDPSGATTSDSSGGAGGESTGVPAQLTPLESGPQLTTSKTFGTTTLAADGTFTVPVTIKVENTGNVNVDNLQISDDLADTSNLGTAFQTITILLSVSVADDGISAGATAVVPTLNTSFDGRNTDPNILDGMSGTLGVGDSVTVVFTIKVDPNVATAPATLQNTAQGSGTEPGETTRTTGSSGGGAGGAGETAGNPTPLVAPEEEAKLTSTKVFGTPVLAADGTFTVPVTIKVVNTGNVDVDELQITDNLAATTNLGTAFKSVTVAPVISIANDGPTTAAAAVAPTANPVAFNGSTQANILSGTDGVLGIGDSVTVVYTVKVDPNATDAPAELQNTAQVSGKDPSGKETKDSSGGNGGENVGIPALLTPPATNPELTSIKIFGTATLAADGTFTVPVTIKVENTGDVNINKLQITDNLAATSNLGATFDSITVAPVISIADGGQSAPAIVMAPTANATTFNGNSQPNILSGMDGVLGIGDSVSVVYTIKVNPNAVDPAATTLGNTAQVSGDDPSGESTTDSSGAGAGENTGEQATLTVPASRPELTSTKTFGRPVPAADGTFTVPVTIEVVNTGDVNIDNIQITDDLADASNLGSTFDSITVAPVISIVDDGSLAAAVAPTANAVAFDGDGQPEILDGDDGVLGVGDSVSAVFTIKVDPNAVNPAATSIANTAKSSGDDPSGKETTDSSGGGAGEDTGEPATLTVPETNPELTSTKTFGKPVLASDGTFTVPVTIKVENTGDVDIDHLQITDDLADTTNFGTAFDSITVAPAITITDDGNVTTAVAPTANVAAFDGDGQPNILDGMDGVLGVGDSVTVVFTAKVNPNAVDAPQGLENTAQTSGDDPSGTPTKDSSGGAGGEETGVSTELTPPEVMPELTSMKTFGTEVLNSDGTYTVPVTITVENTGNVDIDKLQVTDNLADPANFGTAFVSITSAPTVMVIDDGNETTAVAPTSSAGAYNGSSQPNLLTGLDGILGVDDMVSVTFSATINPNAQGAPETLGNTAQTSGADPSGEATTDESGGEGGGAGMATPFNPTLVAMPELGVAKALKAGSPVDLGNGTYQVSYVFVLKNMGNVDLTNVQLEDDLVAMINNPNPNGATFSDAAVTSTDGTLTPSSTYDGSSDINMLSGTDTLLINEVGVIELTFILKPDNYFGPFLNESTGKAKGPDGNEVEDDSQNGSEPTSDTQSATDLTFATPVIANYLGLVQDNCTGFRSCI